MNATTSSLYHSLHPSGTPPLLPIPLSTPSTSRRAGIPEANTPPQNMPLLATPRPGYVETRLRDTERRMMAALELVNLRDRAAVRAEIELLRSKRLAYEQEGIQTREPLARSEAYCRALEARVAVLETHARRLEWQRQAADDLAVQHIMRTQALEDGARDDTLEDIDKSWPEPEGDRLHHQPTLTTDRSSSSEEFWWRRWKPRNRRRSWFNTLDRENGIRFQHQRVCCGKSEIKKLEIELWNLKVKDNDIPAYTNRFQELALICTKFVSNETEKVDKYINGLPDNIYGNVKSSKPKTLDETIELANDITDQKLRTYAKRKYDSKRKADDISRNNQQPFKRQNVAKAYNLGSAEKKTYEGNAPKSTGNTNATNNRGGNGPNPRGNERNGNAAGNPDSNVVTGTFLLNNRYVSILFDTGANRSFVSTVFSSMVDIIPTLLDNHYDVELADGKIVGINTIIRVCTLNFLNHPFTIDLMPVELGSFNAIIGMDWLRRNHTMIVCDEKLVRVPFGNETLVFRGAESYIGRESRLTDISCSKVQEYRAKGCYFFLAQISATKEDDM
nr:reverse transcriptase domain-containing protein [Tanacetum cinerariifolium]